MYKSICFSGHRLNKIKSLIDNIDFNYNKNIVDVQDKFFQIIKTIIYLKVNYYIDIGFRKFYIGMSDGIDLWVGDILLELKQSQYPDIEIVVVKPFSSHGSNFCLHDKSVYNDLIELSSEVVCLQYEQSKDAYLKRNRYMVDNSSNLLAFVFDYKSGTGYTINYAKRLNKSIEVINLLSLKEGFLKSFREK